MKSSSNNSCLDWISCISEALPSVCLLLGVWLKGWSPRALQVRWGLAEVPVAMSAPPREVRAARSPALLLRLPLPRGFPALSLHPGHESSSQPTSPRNGLKLREGPCVQSLHSHPRPSPKGKALDLLRRDPFSAESGQDVAVPVFRSVPAVLSPPASRCCWAQCRFLQGGGQDSSNTAAFSSTVLLQRIRVPMIFTFAALFWDLFDYCVIIDFLLQRSCPKWFSYSSLIFYSYCFPGTGTFVHNTHTSTQASTAGLHMSTRVCECAGGLGWLFTLPFMGISASVVF